MLWTYMYTAINYTLDPVYFLTSKQSKEAIKLITSYRTLLQESDDNVILIRCTEMRGKKTCNIAVSCRDRLVSIVSD
jgi:hypothetical protein